MLTFRFLILGVLLSTMLVTSFAYAEGLPEKAGDVAAKNMSLHGIIFDANGAPSPNLELKVDGVSVITDARGAFRISGLGAGAHVIEVAGASSSFEAANDVVELIVTLTHSGAEFDYEGARDAEPAQLDEEHDVLAKGTLNGRVISLQGKPVADARIFVRGQDVEARTDASGEFTVELSEGLHDISVVHPDYSAQESTALEVKPDATIEVIVELSPSSVALDDFTVTAPRIEGGQAELLEERQNSANVMEVMGAEEMSKTGASDAADALTRVTGITIVGGKYVYVRGLGDRYSSTLLNGATLPSPEPEKRVVPLDLFPADMLESVVVQKNFSPSMPGEFGGGVVELRTRRFPKAFEAELGLSVGYLSGSTFESAPTYTGGSLDWLVFDDGTRTLPDSIASASADSPLKAGDRFSKLGYTPSELEELGESFPNTWKAGEMTLPLNLGIDASVGDGFELGGYQTGYRLGFTWSQDWKSIESTERYFRIGANDQIELRNAYDFVTSTREVVMGLIFTTGVVLGENEGIYLTSLLDRVSDDEYREYSGYNRDAGDTITVTRYRWVERTLLYEQLRGEHILEGLGGLEVDWHYVYSQARRDEPDAREYRYDARPDGTERLSDRPEGNSRVFSTLVDNAHDLNVEVGLPFEQWSGLDAIANVGASAIFKDREVDTRRYSFSILDRSDVLELPPEELFTPENIGPDATLQLNETTRSTDNYAAKQHIFAGWLSTEIPLTASLGLSGGVRLEYSKQNVETFELFNPNGERVPSELETLDPLPAIALAWGFADDMKLRLAGARTVSRPDFRELSPLLFADISGGRAVQGNPDLDRALITHVDGRWEWYFSRTENISVGAFAKFFDSPIESEIRPGAQPLLTFQNADSATNLGLEFEAKKNFAFVTDALRDAFVAANFSLIHSRVTLADGGSQTNTERPLQGQSPWVVNVMAGWDDVERGASMMALYNVSGRRIDSVGALGLPDVYEEPVHRLDLVYKQRLGDTGLKLTLKAGNLLDPSIEYSQGGEVKETRREGRKISAGLAYGF